MTYQQKSITGSFIYSHFKYLCPYHTWLLLNVEPPEEIPAPAERLLMESGIQHETQALTYFQKAYGDKCVVISGEKGLSTEDNFRIRFERTIEAMEQGMEVIYHGILLSSERFIDKIGNKSAGKKVFRGETDFLFKVKNQGEGRFDDYNYEVGDAKSSRSSKFCQQMQVTFYSWLLEYMQGVRPRCGRILTRPLGIENEPVPFKEELFLIDDYIWTLRTFLEEEFWEIAAKDERDFFFHTTSSCETCLYHSHCLDRATSSNDLCLLPDIRKIQKRYLNNSGILEVNALADAQESVLKEAVSTGVTFAGLDKLRLQAQAIVRDEPVPRGIFETPHQACMAITESELDLPEDRESTTSIDFTDSTTAHVYFDMESDPYSGAEYLFGIMVDEPMKKGKRKKGQAEFFMADNYSPESEYGALRAFLERMDRVKKTYGDDGFIIFHYAHYEPTHLMKLAEKYKERDAGLIEKVDYFNRRMVDLYKLIKNTYYLPVSSYSIKDVAPRIKTLMENMGRRGGHEWKKIRTINELEKELKSSKWSKEEIIESINEVLRAIKSFELTDEGMIFDASAEMSVVWFNLFLQHGKRVWQRLIQIYNEDDLIATRAVVDWLFFMQRGADKKRKWKADR